MPSLYLFVMERLPKDIPHREILIDAGFTNYGVLKNHRSIESIRGLAGKKAEEVKDYLQGNYDKPDSSNTKKEIQKYLDDNGIKYDPTKRKDELLALV